MQPISQTLYPRINYLIQQSSKQANRLIRISLFSTSTLGLMMGLVSFLFAPYWIRLILGTGYEPAIPVLRILSLLLPMISVSIVLGIQWMLPLGLDKPFNRIMILAGLLNIALASFMAPHFASIGMAWAVVCTETFVTATMFIIFLREEQIIAPSPLEAR